MRRLFADNKLVIRDVNQLTVQMFIPNKQKPCYSSVVLELMSHLELLTLMGTSRSTSIISDLNNFSFFKCKIKELKH